MKIEIRFKKGISKARHFVEKLPGPMEDSLQLEHLHFAVNRLGFWNAHRQAQISPDLRFFFFFSLSLSPSLSLLALLCRATICFKHF